jgi:ADP-heptose:LPS heptosyltransferase
LAPLICALRAAGHELGALLSPANARAFAPGAFDRVYVVERIPWPAHGSTLESYKLARARARAARYDVALIASEEPEAYRFAREAGAPVRVGFVNGWEKPFKSLWARAQLTRAIVRAASSRRAREHEVETLFRLGTGLHGEARPTKETARLRALLVAGTARKRGDERVALQVVPKAFAGAREHYVAIAQALAREHRVVAIGAPADRALVLAVAASAGVPGTVYEDVAQWREELARMRAVVTPDSGAAHLAGMAGVPCVDLFPAGKDAVHDVLRWSPWASPSRTLIAGPEPSGNAHAVVASLREILDDDER